MKEWLVAVPGLFTVLILFVTFMLLPKAIFAVARRPLAARVKRRYPGAGEVLREEYAVNSFGLESLGPAQVRGNGALVLTSDELCFFQLVPKQELVIRRERITGTSLVRSHLGKVTPMDLLRVDFQGDAGPDAVAFWMRDPASFERQLAPAERAAS